MTADENNDQQRFEEIEARLRKLEAQQLLFNAETVKALARFIPYTPITEEELQDMLHGPRGTSILDIIKEFEQK